jgi:hypothetical protein
LRPELQFHCAILLKRCRHVVTLYIKRYAHLLPF